MPGLDHPVHEATRADTTRRRWCFNRPDWKRGYFAPNGLSAVGHFKLDYVPNRFSQTCRYDKALDVPACSACNWQL